MRLDPNKPLSELVADMEAKEQAAADAAKAQLEALNGPGKPGGGDDDDEGKPGKGPPGFEKETAEKRASLAESLDIVMRASVLRDFLVDRIEGPGDWYA